MLSRVERVLAKVTGRSKWPYVNARLEERMSTGNIPQKLDQPGEIFDNEMTDDIFSYVVDGKVYAAAVEEVAGHGATAEMVGHHMRIQYNPASPKHIYYGPSCSLASKLVVFVAVLATAIAIAYNVITYRQ